MVLDAVAATLLALGLLLATVGLYGMLRKSDIFEQLHAAGLITGPAIILILLASVATRNLRVITSAILLILFILSPRRCRPTRSHKPLTGARSSPRAAEDDADDGA